MSLARWSILILVILPIAMATTPDAATEFRKGWFGCRLVQSEEATACPPTAAPDENRFALRREPGLEAAVLEAKWAKQGNDGVGFEVTIEPGFNGTAPERYLVRHGRPLLLVDLAGSDVRTSTIHLEPRALSSQPAVLWDEHFTLAVTLFVGGARPSGDYSALDRTGHVIRPVPTAAPAVAPHVVVGERDPIGQVILWAVVGVVVLALPFSRTIRASVAVWLFTRLAPDRLGEHPRRQRMLQEIRARPGVQAAELRHELEIPRTPFDHHLWILVRSGFVLRLRVNGQWSLYPRGANLPIAPGETTERVFEALRQTPAIDVEQVARRLAMSERLVRYHLQKLQREGRAIRDRRRNARWSAIVP